MLTSAGAEVVALALLLTVLGFAIARPWRLPEATVAVPAAGLTVLIGLVTPARAVQRLGELGPTIGFLAAILLLAFLAEREGVFRWLGERLGAASVGRPTRLLALVFLAASATTAVLSLDATVVLLTPVVFQTAAGLRLRPKPHVYACTHLANSASTLLPVSNLTNLLAFAASGLSFAAFAALMALPWLVAVAVEFLVFLRFFRTDLTGSSEVAARTATPTPAVALVLLGLTLLGFGLSGLLGLAPVWVAAAGAGVLAVRGLVTGAVRPTRLVREASPLFCLFVLSLGVVVTGVTDHGLGQALAAVLPTRASLAGLLAVAAIAAVLANLLNNLPATLAMLGALGSGSHPGLVLAMLLGVNIGPNLTYVGSLATLLWRRVLGAGEAAPSQREYLRLGALSVPATLVASVLALWLGLTAGRGWLL